MLPALPIRRFAFARGDKARITQVYRLATLLGDVPVETRSFHLESCIFNGLPCQYRLISRDFLMFSTR
jgi:hypothetical protein